MRRGLLQVDGRANLLLGVVLLWYPRSLAELLGLPSGPATFFARILGGTAAPTPAGSAVLWTLVVFLLALSSVEVFGLLRGGGCS